MKRTALLLSAALLAAPCALLAQSPSSSFVAPETTADSTSALFFEGGAGQAASPIRGTRNGGAVSDGMFSRLAFGAGISPLGIQLQAATNITPHFNVRGTGNFF
ncbi:MAG: hypothetical protein P4K86_02240, partial [Terracidiphilus sp.]|nr:hypothetical protein [Terracidiphilus sp.]